MQSTLRTFTIIDFIGDEAFYTVQRRNLASPSFNSPTNADAPLNQLLEDGQDIQDRFVDALVSTGSVHASELGQSTAIEAARFLQQRYGIQLEVMVIP